MKMKEKKLVISLGQAKGNYREAELIKDVLLTSRLY